MSTAESRIADLESRLAHFIDETRSRLDDHKEDIGALAEVVSRLEDHTTAVMAAIVNSK